MQLRDKAAQYIIEHPEHVAAASIITAAGLTTIGYLLGTQNCLNAFGL